MSMLESAHGSVTASVVPDSVVAPQPIVAEPQHIYSCSRLGLQANPPSFRLTFGWFRRR